MKKKVFISGANLFSGGTLSIFADCLAYADINLTEKYDVVALVYLKALFPAIKNIKLIEFPDVRNSYLNRFNNEYFHYKSLTKDEDIHLWFSINDMSSNVKAATRAVYCHNPSPFRKLIFKDLIDQPQLFFFSLFYKYLYKINIKKNNYVIVQQNWIKREFINFFNLNPEKIIVARPLDSPKISVPSLKNKNDKILFFYPAVARPFKNFEVIINAAKILAEKNISNFKVVLTIDGTENNYAKRILAMAKGVDGIEFTGILSREKVADYYALAHCLIFPSKLETWGLPITEFKTSGKQIFLADLPYAKETLGKYDKAVFFDVDDANQLAELMLKIIRSDTIEYSATSETTYIEPSTSNWQQLFDILLSQN